MMHKFLIYISHSYALPVGMPLETEILKRGYSVKWFSDHHEGAEALKTKDNVLASIQAVLDYEPHIILTITDNVPDFINALKVQVFHGFNSEKRPEKNMEAHFRMRGLFDLYCTQGPSSTSIFKQLEQKHQTFKIAETGWSKVDPLFPLQPREAKTIPTVMIASTFTERLSLAHNDEVYKEIKRLSLAGIYNFQMVLHPKIPTEIKEKWAKLSNEHFSYFDTTDLIPLFKQADIMFSDTTSAIQEFLLQKKPVVTFKHTFDHDYLINIETITEIEGALNTALTYPKELISHIDTFVNELHPYFDGKSSERIIDTTIAYLHAEKSDIKPKPLNLIRKYKIRKQLNYFTWKSYSKPFKIKQDPN